MVARGRYAAFVAALVVFLVGLRLQITAYIPLVASGWKELKPYSDKAVPGGSANRSAAR
jgi:hypothetical protein